MSRGSSNGNAGRVLIVEDDDDIRESLVEFLEEHGYRPVEAHHGRDALHKLSASAHRPRLIVLDLMMPVMDGWTFVEECHRRMCCTEVPIVVTSASHDLPKTAERLRSFGVRTCLAKPFDVDGLLALVERYAPSAPAA